MKNNNGWIKVHRSIMDGWVYDNPWALKGFLHLCLTVNIKDSTTNFDGKVYDLQAGQRITSIQTLSEEMGFTWRTTNKLMQQYEDDNMIRMDRLGKAFILTVVNFKKYQSLLASRNESRDESRDESRNASRQIKKNKNIENDRRSKRSKEGAQRRLNLWEGAPEE